MNSSLSTPIKIVAYILFVGGLLGAIASFIDLTTSTVTSTDGPQGPANQLVQVMTIVSGLIKMSVGWFLFKGKQWAYIFACVMIILSLLLHVVTLLQLGTTRWYGLVLSITILSLLIAGKKDFKKVVS